MLAQEESGALAASLDELKAYLRIETDGEDAVLAGLLRSAAALCEQFVGQWLIVRGARETVAAGQGWQRLGARPVMAIETVEAVDGEGVAQVLPVDAYAIDIDAAGGGLGGRRAPATPPGSRTPTVRPRPNSPPGWPRPPCRRSGAAAITP